MKRTHCVALFLALGLLLPLLGMLGRSRAQPVSAGTSAVAVQSPILGPFIDIWVDAVDNYDAAVAYNSHHDEYLVVWMNEQGLNTHDIYACRVGSDGSLPSCFCVVTQAGEKYSHPAVAYSPMQDTYLVVYMHEYSVTDYDIQAKMVGWNGGWISNWFGINTDSNNQYWPAVAYNSQDDEFLVVYFEDHLPAILTDIAANRVRASNSQVLGKVTIATGPGEKRFSPDVAYDTSGNQFLIAYEYEFSATDWDIYGKVASANLGWLSNEIHISDWSRDQHSVAVVAGPDEYLVVWHDGTVFTTDYDIYGRRVNGAGVPQGSPPGFPIATATSNFHSDPDVAYGAGYGYLVTWMYSGNDWDVYGRYVMRGQNSAAGTEFAIDAGSNVQWNPAVACAPSGDCLVVEHDNWPGPDYEIRGRFVMPYHLYLPVILRNY